MQILTIYTKSIPVDHVDCPKDRVPVRFENCFQDCDFFVKVRTNKKDKKELQLTCKFPEGS